MNNLKQLIAENPDYLKSGIPTQLIQQMFSQKAQPNVMQPKVTNNRVLNVCYDFVIIFNFTYGVRYSRQNAITTFYPISTRLIKSTRKMARTRRWELPRHTPTIGHQNVSIDFSAHLQSEESVLI